MDTPAVLSTHARLARCPLRPSSPARRRLHAIDAGQLTLPFLVGFEPSSALASGEPGDHALVTSPRVGEPPAPHDLKPQTPRQSILRERSRKRKPPVQASVPVDSKLLVSREEAAAMVSLSVRSIDYLLASKQLPFRKIGTRTMIPVTELQRFARMNHPERIAS